MGFWDLLFGEEEQEKIAELTPQQIEQQQLHKEVEAYNKGTGNGKMQTGAGEMLMEDKNPNWANLKYREYYYMAFTEESSAINNRKQLYTVVLRHEYIEYTTAAVEVRDMDDVNEVEWAGEHKCLAYYLDGNGDIVYIKYCKAYFTYEAIRCDSSLDRGLGIRWLPKPTLVEKNDYTASNETIKTLLETGEFHFDQADIRMEISSPSLKILKSIGEFTRQNDTLFVATMINKEISNLEDAQYFIGLLGVPFSFGKAAVATQKVIDWASYLVGAIPSFDRLFDLRKPIYISGFNFEVFENHFRSNVAYADSSDPDYGTPIWELIPHSYQGPYLEQIANYEPNKM